MKTTDLISSLKSSTSGKIKLQEMNSKKKLKVLKKIDDQ